MPQVVGPDVNRLDAGKDGIALRVLTLQKLKLCMKYQIQ